MVHKSINECHINQYTSLQWICHFLVVMWHGVDWFTDKAFKDSLWVRLLALSQPFHQQGYSDTNSCEDNYTSCCNARHGTHTEPFWVVWFAFGPIRVGFGAFSTHEARCCSFRRSISPQRAWQASVCGCISKRSYAASSASAGTSCSHPPQLTLYACTRAFIRIILSSHDS